MTQEKNLSGRQISNIQIGLLKIFFISQKEETKILSIRYLCNIHPNDKLWGNPILANH